MKKPLFECAMAYKKKYPTISNIAKKKKLKNLNIKTSERPKNF